MAGCSADTGEFDYGRAFGTDLGSGLPELGHNRLKEQVLLE